MTPFQPPYPPQNPALMVIEGTLTMAGLLLALGWPHVGEGWFARIEERFARIAARRGLSVLGVGLSVILIRLALLPLFPVPLPMCTDDFSFLLLSDTFLHGRLANPTPALWQHFQSIHIDLVPTYVSMYFPGQGLVMAFGKLVFGSEWFGLLLVSALMCAAITWMLQGWLPARWALLGGILAVLRLGVFSYWTNTYHAAGSLAALAGALVLGALPRFTRTGRARYGVLIGLGFAILVLCRPYEGVLIGLPVAFMIGRWAVKGKNRPTPAGLMRKAALPVALVLAAVAWLGYYDLQAFGKASTLPYTINRTTYAMAPYYIWQQERPIENYPTVEMRHFYEGEVRFFRKIHSWSFFFPATAIKFFMFLYFFGGVALMPVLLFIFPAVRDRRLRVLLVCLGFLAAGLSIEIYILAHYVAAGTAAFYAFGLQALRHMRQWRSQGKLVGRAMLRFMVATCVLMFALRMVARPLHLVATQFPAGNWNWSWIGPEHYGTEREAVLKQLESQPGRQLAIVRYDTRIHNPIDEWVYNGAEFNGAKVLWAQDMGTAENQKLIEYYGDRSVWLVEPDKAANPIARYPVNPQPGR